MTTGSERNLILLGPLPAPAKGHRRSDWRRVSAFRKISTGDDVLRAARRAGTPLGLKADQFMSLGQLVPDEVVIGLVEERLQHADAQPGFILDGFPRTLPQAEALDGVLAHLHRDKLRVIEVRVDEEALIARLSGRLSCPKCGASYHIKFTPPQQPNICDNCGSTLVSRSDDQPAAIAKRLADYREVTQPLVEHYRQTGSLQVVDGVGSLEVVLGRMIEALDLPAHLSHLTH